MSASKKQKIESAPLSTIASRNEAVKDLKCTVMDVLHDCDEHESGKNKVLLKAAQDIVRRSLIFTQKPLEFRNIVESQILSLLSDDEYSLEQVMKFRNVEGINIFHICDIIIICAVLYRSY